MIWAAAIAVVIVFGRLPNHRRESPSAPSSPEEFARLLSVAVSAGLPLGPALERVVGELSGPVRDEVEGVLRSARNRGLTGALLHADLATLGPALARATSTGAPVSRTLEAHLSSLASSRIAAALEQARTAPVKLMIPLVLCLLPGFTALVVGPELADHLIGLTQIAP